MKNNVLKGMIKSMKAIKNTDLNVKIVDIADTHSHYNRITKTIVIDMQRDKRNNKGTNSTFYHELGHHVDWELGLPSHDNNFRLCLIVELRCILKRFDIENLQNYISNTPKSNGLSDMLSGCTDKYMFKYKHSHKYWNTSKYRLPYEAFAHFYEATMRDDKYKIGLYKKYLPKSYNMFINMIK